MNNPHDEEHWEDDIDVPCDDTNGIESDPDEDWVMSDGTTGPVGMQFLATLTPEDFV